MILNYTILFVLYAWFLYECHVTITTFFELLLTVHKLGFQYTKTIRKFSV